MTTSSAIALQSDGQKLSYVAVVASGGLRGDNLMGGREVLGVRPCPFTKLCGRVIDPERECQVEVEAWGDRMWINATADQLVVAN